ncbi:hypothetical protein DH2020_027314 [Rehmannia glutinosa]|uniref:Uncharacterized protein n=1 Tax=Rehmannia glutinosa TaxID=99300 RepID=A0ABR0VWC4_REHGL
MRFENAWLREKDCKNIVASDWRKGLEGNLIGGDANTKYFHTIASTRQRHNSISRLKGEDGSWLTWEIGLDSHIVNYFVNIFSSSEVECALIISCIEPKITEAQNRNLLEPFSAVEIKEALFSMLPDKSPGPDGMNPTFFQKFWDITGSEVISSCLAFMNSCSFPEGFNDTNIVLIPKKNNPRSCVDLRR